MVAVSDEPWSNFSTSDYPDAGSYCDACLINTNTGPRSAWSKGNCKLPVREPDGDVNRNAVHAAAAVLAGSRGGVDAPPAAKRSAAMALMRLYGMCQEPPPDSLRRLAGN